MDRRGDFKYDLLISVTLGLLLLTLSLYFIFNEYFTNEDVDWEVCRQSIILRASLPDTDLSKFIGLDLKVSLFKDEFPLKCETVVREINEGDVRDMDSAERIVAKTIAECWALYDNGDSNAFPAEIFSNSVCVPCARIHLTEDAKKYLRDSGKELNIRNALDQKMETEDYSYYNYLQNSGRGFAAFSIGNSIGFNLEGQDFFEVLQKTEVSGIDSSDAVSLVNRYTMKHYNDDNSFIEDFVLPEVLDPDYGDLLINYGIAVTGKNDFEYIPYLFYFQVDQLKDPFFEVERSRTIGRFKVCEQWEGVPR